MSAKIIVIQTFYSQFYICDSLSEFSTNPMEFWSDQNLKDKMSCSFNLIGISTLSYGPINAEIEFLNNEPQINLNEWDHVVESGINIISGLLQIRNCPDFGIVFKKKISSGKYRVRLLGNGFADFNSNVDTSTDFYRIEIWPSDNMKKQILKTFSIN